MAAKLTVILKQPAGGGRELGGAEIQLVRSRAVVRTGTTDSRGECAFSDVEPGGYVVRVARPPPFFGAFDTDRQQTIDTADVAVEVPVTPLIVTVVTEHLPTSGFELPAIEIRDRAGSKVAEAELRQRNTAIPIPVPGMYRVVPTKVVAPQTAPPEEEYPRADLTEVPTQDVVLPQKTIQLKPVAQKPDNPAESLEGVRFVVRDPVGRVVHDGIVGADGIALRRTGAHSVQLGGLPADVVVDGPSSHVVDVAWADTEKSVSFATRKPGPRTSGLAIVMSWVIVGLCFVGGLVCIWLTVDSAGWLKPKFESSVGAAAVAASVVGVCLLLLTLSGRNRLGLFTPLVGADGRTSTSRIAPYLWTLFLVVVVMRNAAGAGWDGTKLANTLKENWDDYLILLGGPFAAAVLAKGVVSWRVANGTLQKTENAGEVNVAQAVQDDSGNTNLIDAQYLIFNVVAMTFFWAAWIAAPPNLPKIPPMILALTSSAAALYVANKAVEQNRPVITGITPGSAKVGDQLTIGGQNFLPGEAADRVNVAVTIEGFGSVPMVGEPENSKVVAQVPHGVSVGVRNVTVTSAARVTTEPRTVEIVSDQPEIIGVAGSEVVAGERVQVLGRNFATAADPDGRVLVAFGSRWVPATLMIAGGASQLDVVAPRDLAGSSVTISVRTARGATSSPMTVPMPAAPAIVDASASRDDQNLVTLTLTARGVLPPGANWPNNLRAVLVGGSGTRILQETTVAGSTDRLVAVTNAPVDAAAAQVEVVVVDWQGRQSMPRQVAIS